MHFEVKSVGEPDAGNPHVRFDERVSETDDMAKAGLRQWHKRKRQQTVFPSLKRIAPTLDSTEVRMRVEGEARPAGVPREARASSSWPRGFMRGRRDDQEPHPVNPLLHTMGWHWRINFPKSMEHKD